MSDLKRFLDIDDETYNRALNEVRNGLKVSHWMWYIFPQIFGLGHSYASVFYSIKDLDEARDYINNDILRERLLRISDAVYNVEDRTIYEIFGNIDSIKLKSSMTLFELVSDEKIFGDVLEKYFNGERDEKTLLLCEHNKRR